MLSLRTINYAAPPAGSFWVWSADYDAIEWHDGSTLAMWQELHGLLKFLRDEGGLPPLGAVLLLLAACRDEWLSLCIAFHEKVMAILGVTESDAIPLEIKDTLVRGLKTVNDLPRDLRASFPAKCLLVSALFEGGPYSLPRDDSRQILADLTVRGPGQLAGSSPRISARDRFSRDLRALKTGLARHDAASLEARLRTGLESHGILPASIPEMIPDDPRLLLDRLTAAGGLGGAAATVARRTIAMVNFPGGFRTPQDLPVGGISDITNRGTVDRLLPGELAWDDLVLAARLVHNEALYFRREIPPQHLAIGHTILMDRGLRLWGSGRVFALGVALGLRHHPALNGPGKTFECLAATADGAGRIDLATPEGVHHALEELHPAPGPEAFLTSWYTTALVEDRDVVPDVTFITADANPGVATTRRLLGEITSWVHPRGGCLRVIALGRTGGVEIQRWAPGGIRTLFSGELDLDEIIPKSSEPAKRPAPPPLRAKGNPLHDLLPIYSLVRLPIIFPMVPQGSAILKDSDSPESPVTGVTDGGQLMRWPRIGWGGYLWRDKIPGRQHWVVRDEHQEIILIASGSTPGDAVRVFRIEQDLPREVAVTASRHPFPRMAAVSGGAVLLAYSDKVEAISLSSGHRLAELPVANWPRNRMVLNFDGERIHLIDTGAEAQPEQRWTLGDVLWPRMITPDGAAIIRDRLWVRCGTVFYQFHPLKLGWAEGRPAMHSFPAFERSTFSPAAGIFLESAPRTRPGIEIWKDPRGILHLRDPANPAGSWSILLSTAAASVWHADLGICSMEPRLRLPDTPAPDTRSLHALHRFLADQPTPP